MSVYTKRGDGGKTSLFSPGKEIRIGKESRRINAIGSLDEANSSIGVVSSFLRDQKTKKILQGIQNNLFLIGSILAGGNFEFNKEETRILEKEIDRLEGKLPVLANFILPGGSRESALLHLSRSVVRRAERSIIALNKKRKVNPFVIAYLNRLSDYLFILAREINLKKGAGEIVWKMKR